MTSIQVPVVHVIAGELAAATPTERKLLRASLAPNTLRAYRLALQHFAASGCPKTDAGVAAYLGQLYEAGQAPASAALVAAALACEAKLREAPSPVGPQARPCWRDIGRKRTDADK